VPGGEIPLGQFETQLGMRVAAGELTEETANRMIATRKRDEEKKHNIW